MNRTTNRLSFLAFSLVFVFISRGVAAGEQGDLRTAGASPSSSPHLVIGSFKNNAEWVHFITGLVRKYYPEIFERRDIPDGYTVAFLMKDRNHVLRHAAFIDNSPSGTFDYQILSSKFPEGLIDEFTEHGSMYFGSVKGKHGRFCAMYAASQKELP
jgi:hypothetical protein